jgi:hypothetical protein
VEERPVDFVAEDWEGFGLGVVGEGVEEGLGEDSAGGVLGVAVRESVSNWLCFGDAVWEL